MKNLMLFIWYHKCWYFIVQIWSNLKCFNSPKNYYDLQFRREEVGRAYHIRSHQMLTAGDNWRLNAVSRSVAEAPWWSPSRMEELG